MPGLRCRECGAVGIATPLLNVVVNGRPLTTAPQLPRCGCFLRGHRGQLPAAVTALLAHAPRLPDEAVPAHAAFGEREQPSMADADSQRRPTYSAKQLMTRELMVYMSECSEEALLGSVVVTAEHKLSDVIAMLRHELDVAAPAELYRGARGEQLRVPIHKRQLKQLALPFFPSEAHHLLVQENGE